MTKPILRIIIGTVALIVAYSLIQQGPRLLSKVSQYPIQFSAESPRKFVADLSSLPGGKYFVSVGRTLGDTEIYFNDVLLQRGQLTAGVPLELSDGPGPKRVSIVWLAREEWRKYLYDQPVITGYGVGFLIQEWRKFVGIFMGPIASLALILFALFNHRVSKGATGLIFPHLMCGISGLIYGLFLAGIPDLFFSFTVNLPYQVALRIILSGAIMYLISTYAERRFRALLWLHVIGVALVVPLSFVSRDWLIVHYKVELLFFAFATLIPTIALMRLKSWTSEVELMICLGLSLTILEAFSGVVYIIWGPSSLTVWSPSFIAVLAVTNFYFIYKKAVTRSIEVQLSKKHYQLAAQIAHDIRSPLAALNAIVQSSEGVEESAKIQIKSVVARIRDIANNLLRTDSLRDSSIQNTVSRIENVPDSRVYGLLHEVGESQLISQRLSSIISEKRFQFSDRMGVEIYINEACLGMPYFANVQPAELGRVLSNLIDNAVHAIGEKGKVTVDLKGDEHLVQIIIEDNGIGMSSEILSKIGTRGFSYGKDGNESGAGLGVYHALETIKSWSGNLRYLSDLGKGTKAIITLPRANALPGLVEKIEIGNVSTIVVLDDDPLVHKVWKRRFDARGVSQVQCICFTKCEDLIRWYREKFGDIKNPLYLIDYKIDGSDLTGLDVIEMLGIGDISILVTNSWEDHEIRRRCGKGNVKILPKMVDVPIECLSGVAECV
jgi:signal transduction histidine kinase